MTTVHVVRSRGVPSVHTEDRRVRRDGWGFDMCHSCTERIACPSPTPTRRTIGVRVYVRSFVHVAMWYLRAIAELSTVHSYTVPYLLPSGGGGQTENLRHLSPPPSPSPVLLSSLTLPAREPFVSFFYPSPDYPRPGPFLAWRRVRGTRIVAWGTPWGFIQQGARVNVRACAFVRVSDLRGREFLGTQNWFAVVSLVRVASSSLGRRGGRERIPRDLPHSPCTALLRG